ncbi:hypothetical protein GCK32_002347 [Trichostrongylus colubriformis]|uniref:TatD n=1 Tax=Trichostrongylus colubriformis TaxID=6319 RepID=A0AAN8FD51_TRICO
MYPYDVSGNRFWHDDFPNGSRPDNLRFSPRPLFCNDNLQWRPGPPFHNRFWPQQQNQFFDCYNREDFMPWGCPRGRSYNRRPRNFVRAKRRLVVQPNRPVPYRMPNDDDDLPWHRSTIKKENREQSATNFQVFDGSSVYGSGEMMQTSEMENPMEPSMEVSDVHAVDGDAHQSSPDASIPLSLQGSPSDDSVSKERKRKKHPDQPLYVSKLQSMRSPKSELPSTPPKMLEPEPTRKQPSTFVQKQDNFPVHSTEVYSMIEELKDEFGASSVVCKIENDRMLSPRVVHMKRNENKKTSLLSPRSLKVESCMSQMENLNIESNGMSPVADRLCSDCSETADGQSSQPNLIWITSVLNNHLSLSDAQTNNECSDKGIVVLPDVVDKDQLKQRANGCVLFNKWKDHSYENIQGDVLEPYIDSHCHFDFIYNKCKGNLETWKRSYPRVWHNYFSGCIPNFIDPSLFTTGNTHYDPIWIQEQIKDPSVLGTTFGCHPHFAHIFKDTIHETLVQLLKEKDKYKIVAVGECGIDYMKSDGDPEVQKKVFLTQLNLSKKYDLPVVIHCRSGPRGSFDAEQSCFEVIEKAEMSRHHHVHRHCFNENWDVARRWLTRFWNVRFGFTSLISSWEQNEVEKYEVLKRLPLQNMVLETDAPYFRPNQYDCCRSGKVAYDKTSFPPMAVNVAFVIAKAKNIDVNEVIRVTTLNTRHLSALQYVKNMRIWVHASGKILWLPLTAMISEVPPSGEKRKMVSHT